MFLLPQVTLDDLAPVMDSDTADTEVRCLESMNNEEIDRLKALVLAFWMFTVTSLSAYPGKRGPGARGAADQRKAQDDKPSLSPTSQGCTVDAEDEEVAPKLVALKINFRIEGDCTPYTMKPSADPMDVTCAPVTTCRVAGMQGGA